MPTRDPAKRAEQKRRYRASLPSAPMGRPRTHPLTCDCKRCRWRRKQRDTALGIYVPQRFDMDTDGVPDPEEPDKPGEPEEPEVPDEPVEQEPVEQEPIAPKRVMEAQGGRAKSRKPTHRYKSPAPPAPTYCSRFESVYIPQVDVFLEATAEQRAWVNPWPVGGTIRVVPL